MDQELIAYLDQRFNEVSRQLENFRVRFGQQDIRLGQVDSRFGFVESRLERFESRLRQAEEVVHQTRMTMIGLRDDVERQGRDPLELIREKYGRKPDPTV
ncbi:MAG TPA: hypothetical protein VKK31_21020 [Thermoanaerobaculia bacterium]|nr:hypothetical protein [Thermoanaerobaculia bacterium]